MTNNAIAALGEVLKCPCDRFIPYQLQMQDSLSSQLESDSGSIFMFEDHITGEKYVVKIKSENYWKELEKIVNEDHSVDSQKKFFAGCVLYQTQHTHIREATIYAHNDDFIQKYTPIFLGSVRKSDNVYLIMRYTNFADQVPLDEKTEKAIHFLADLHSRFYKQYDELNSLGLNLLTPHLFRDSIELVRSICSRAIQRIELPEPLANEIREYIERIDEEFVAMQYSGLTFCHCDFAFRNMAFSSDTSVIIDWELSTALEPQFDIVQFLVDYPKDLDSHIIQKIIDTYFIHASFCHDESSMNRISFHKSMLRNLYHYYSVRLAALVIIDKTIRIHWIQNSIKNYVSIWKFLQSQG